MTLEHSTYVLLISHFNSKFLLKFLLDPFLLFLHFPKPSRLLEEPTRVLVLGMRVPSLGPRRTGPSRQFSTPGLRKPLSSEHGEVSVGLTTTFPRGVVSLPYSLLCLYSRNRGSEVFSDPPSIIYLGTSTCDMMSNKRSFSQTRICHDHPRGNRRATPNQSRSSRIQFKRSRQKPIFSFLFCFVLRSTGVLEMQCVSKQFIRTSIVKP